jgi:hypothetical protein
MSDYSTTRETFERDREAELGNAPRHLEVLRDLCDLYGHPHEEESLRLLPFDWRLCGGLLVRTSRFRAGPPFE